MLVPVTDLRNNPFLLNMDHVLAIASGGDRDGDGLAVTLVPERDTERERIWIAGDLTHFIAPKGFMPTTLITPHAPPVHALVNLGAVLRADACEAGTLLRCEPRTGRHALLVSSTLSEIARFETLGEAA